MPKLAEGRIRMAEQSNVKLACSVREAAGLLGISSCTAYRAVKAGDLPAVRLRGRVLIPLSAIDRILECATEEMGRQINE
ncbi:helix-turn-helix domain-containing protein [Candidatus Bipolaricaulota bacterium]